MLGYIRTVKITQVLVPVTDIVDPKEATPSLVSS